MPLIVPELPKVSNLRTLLGKKFIDESIVPDADLNERMKDYPIENVVFKSQLPPYVLILKQSVDKTAITGAVQSGMLPLIVNEDDIIVRVY